MLRNILDGREPNLLVNRLTIAVNLTMHPGTIFLIKEKIEINGENNPVLSISSNTALIALGGIQNGFVASIDGVNKQIDPTDDAVVIKVDSNGNHELIKLEDNLSEATKNLFAAVKNLDIKGAKEALEQGADIDARNHMEETVIMMAISSYESQQNQDKDGQVLQDIMSLCLNNMYKETFSARNLKDQDIFDILGQHNENEVNLYDSIGQMVGAHYSRAIGGAEIENHESGLAGENNNDIDGE